MKTLQELAKEALDVQDACNILGVTKGFARVVQELSEIEKNRSKLAIHPIIILWMDKLNDMTYRPDFGQFTLAFDHVYDFAKGQSEVAK
jgi:hypothetical protein